MNAVCAGKLWDPLRTRVIPERLRGVFTTRRYTNPRLPYLTGMVFLRKEVAVWFGANSGSAGMPYRPTSSPALWWGLNTLIEDIFGTSVHIYSRAYFEVFHAVLETTVVPPGIVQLISWHFWSGLWRSSVQFRAKMYQILQLIQVFLVQIKHSTFVWNELTCLKT